MYVFFLERFKCVTYLHLDKGAPPVRYQNKYSSKCLENSDEGVVYNSTEPLPYEIVVKGPNTTSEPGINDEQYQYVLNQDYIVAGNSAVDTSSGENDTYAQPYLVPTTVKKQNGSLCMDKTGNTSFKNEMNNVAGFNNEYEQCCNVQHQGSLMPMSPQQYLTPAPVTAQTESPQQYLTPVPVTTAQTESPQQYLTPVPVTAQTESPQQYLTPAPVTAQTESPQQYLTPAPVTAQTESPQQYLTPVTTKTKV